jgi:hypothetical protein
VVERVVGAQAAVSRPSSQVRDQPDVLGLRAPQLQPHPGQDRRAERRGAEVLAQEHTLYLAQLAQRRLVLAARVGRQEARQVVAYRAIPEVFPRWPGHERAQFIDPVFVRRRRGQIVALIGDLHQRAMELMFGRE